MMSSLATYGYCMLVSAAFVALLSMSTDFFVSYVNDILIPCQHDTPWIQSEGRCMCEDTSGVFAGKYCDECQCENLGICAVVVSSGQQTSRWGCRCPSHQKWVGTLCDHCNAVDQTESSCRGDCKEGYYGPRCNTLCLSNWPETHEACQEIVAGSGTCNACNGHGKCSDQGACECDEGYFTSLGGEQCSMTCKNCDEASGTCRSIGGKLQCICKPNYFGRDCSQSCLTKDSSFPCSGHGTCEMDLLENLKCVCNPHFTGDFCSVPCPGDNTFPTACSGHGTCTAKTTVDNTTIGVCECQGSWESDDCSCNELFTCSGRGTCNADGSCECYDEGPSGPKIAPEEMHFAGNACERCQPNWFGATCHLYCDLRKKYESNPDTDGLKIGCNHHGTCKVITKDAVEHITCACPNTDPHTFCATCVPNYYPDIRLTSMSVSPCSIVCNPQKCSGRGKCNSKYNGTNNLCICDETENGLDTLDPERFCSTCRPNWYPSNMNMPNRCTSYCAADGHIEKHFNIYFTEGEKRNYDLNGDVSAQKVCAKSADGFVSDSDCRVCSSSALNDNKCMADGTCKCDFGITGSNCEITCGGTNGLACSGHGRCVRDELELWFDPNTDDYRCECMPYDSYTAKTRLRLLKRGFQVAPPPVPEHYGKFCEFHCPHYNKEMCADRGVCKTAVAIARNPITVNKTEYEAGNAVNCRRDEDCVGIDGAFCARLSTPWDSLVRDVPDQRSFFDTGFPGEVCAASDKCIESIYDIDYPRFCVNVLGGWYPNVLNTAECAYNIQYQCRDMVQDFFISEYDPPGKKTWCQTVLQEMLPSLDKNSQCNATAESSANTVRFNNVLTPLCHLYLLETTCNAQSECVYDQNLDYINETDHYCTDDARITTNTCFGRCQRSGDGSCQVATYCRAKTCEDQLFENNIENLCLNMAAPCNKMPTSDNGEKMTWTDFCAAAIGAIRSDDPQISSMETFYSCLMFANSQSPVLPEVNVPGSVQQHGQLEIFSEHVLISDLRQSFISSRTPVPASCEADPGISGENLTHFCKNHIDSVAPSWYKNRAPIEDWFLPYLLFCDGNPVDVFSKEYQANEIKLLLGKMGRSCAVEYRISSVDAVSGFEDSSETHDSLAFSGKPFTIKCLNALSVSNGRPIFKKDVYEIDFSSDWSTVASGCVVVENELFQRWGGSIWTPTKVQDTFKKSCQQASQAMWIPKQFPKPTLEDMNICGARDKVKDCPECSTHQVKCETPVQFRCISRNPCRKNAQCLKNTDPQLDNDRISRDYYCDTRKVVKISDITLKGKTYAATAGLNRLIFLDTKDTISPTGQLVIGKLEANYHQRGSPKDGVRAIRVDEDVISSIVGPASSVSVPYISNLQNCDDNINWLAYCHLPGVQLGRTLRTSPPFGLKGRHDFVWKGDAPLLKENSLLIRRAELTATDAPIHSLQIKVASGEWMKTQTTFTNGTELVAYHRKDFEIKGPLSKVAVSGMHDPIIVSSVLVGVSGAQVESVLSFEDAIESASGEREFYFGSEFVHSRDGDKRSNFTDWSFDVDGHLSVKREVGSNLNDGSAASTNNIKSPPLVKGVRWPLGSLQSTKLRISGWAQLTDTEEQLANMQLLSADYVPIVEVSVYQTSSLPDDPTMKRVLVNGNVSLCEVPTYKWWYWEIDASESSHKSRTENGRTVIDHTFDVSVKVNGILCKDIEKKTVTSLVVEREHHRRLTVPFRTIGDRTFEECRTECHAQEKCQQWSHTRRDSHCYLYSKQCHEDEQCIFGTHTLRSFSPKKLGFFDIWTQSTNSITSWTRLRAEPLIDSPVLKPLGCQKVEYSKIDPRWSEEFNNSNVPWTPDATAICNGLLENWQLMPGMVSGICGGQHNCNIPKNNLDQCSRNIEFAEPEITEEDCHPLRGLNWTAYCHYKQSFVADAGGNIPFLPAVSGSMKDICVSSNEYRRKADHICTVPSEWYLNCFEHGNMYKDFCSTECLDHIEELVAGSASKDGLCKTRETLLDITTLKDGITPSAVSSNCSGCNIEGIVITDFCLTQNMYHSVDGTLKIPDLAHSECHELDGCIDLLTKTMKVRTLRNWCSDLSQGTVQGVCSQTTCECDNQEHPGVAGEFCELTCPTGFSEGQELACSGRNGRCFAKDPAERQTDEETQKAEGAVRNKSDWPNGAATPVWEIGPSPTMSGICQCALGSGLACSIPCDGCNTGSYGPVMASQYGICDSYDGICRSLPAFMRYNMDFKTETGRTVPKYSTAFKGHVWEYPEDFLYESDLTIFEAAKNYTLADQQLRSGIEYLSDNIPASQKNAIFNMIRVWNTLCVPKTYVIEGAVQIQYLDNSENVTFRGLRVHDDEKILLLNTFALKPHNPCRKIKITEHMFLCFENGQLHAYDTNKRSRNKEGGGRLLVFRDGAGPTAYNGMSFAAYGNSTVYAYGGVRDYDLKFKETFRDVYRINIQREPWDPTDIVVVKWDKLTTTGVAPPRQENMPMLAYFDQIFLAANDGMYILSLNSRGHEWTFVSHTQEIESFPIYMHGNAQKELVIHYENNQTMVQFFSGDLKKWNYTLDYNGVVPNYERVGAQEEENIQCHMNISNFSIAVGGNTIATFNHLLKDVTLYLEEWALMNTSRDSGIHRRVLNSIYWRYSDGMTSDLTELETTSAVELVTRVYMHQARWSVSNTINTMLGLNSLVTTPLINHIELTGQSIPFTGPIRSLPAQFFEQIPVVTSAAFGVAIEGQIGSRQMVIIANYNSADSLSKNLNQEIILDTDALQVSAIWGPEKLEVTLKQRDGPGLMQWTATKYFRTWYMIIKLEEWSFNDSPGPSVNGRRLANENYIELYAMTTSPANTYQMDRKTANFLQYSGSHCSLSSDEQCPGMLPFLNLPCSGRGRCGISCQCTCEVAKSVLQTDPDALTKLDPFKSPFRGYGCEHQCPGYDGYNLSSICSGHPEQCQPDGTCACPQGKTGPACQFNCPKNENGEICSTHGGCGTKALDLRSFEFQNEHNLDTIVSMNMKQFSDAFEQFYGRCFEKNFIEQKAQWSPAAAENVHDEGNVRDEGEKSPGPAAAIQKCQTINAKLKLDFTNETLRFYPEGRCLGIREKEWQYVPVVLVVPTPTISPGGPVLELFVCALSECSMDIDIKDDHSVNGVQTTLVGGASFVIILDYVHGHSTGTKTLNVNGHIIHIDIDWTRTNAKLTIRNNKDFDDFIILNRAGHFIRIELTIENAELTYNFYRSMVPAGTKGSTVWIAPSYTNKYTEIKEDMSGYVYLTRSEDTPDEPKLLTTRHMAENECDQQEECLGVIEWKTFKTFEDITKEPILYSLYAKIEETDSSRVSGPLELEGTYFKKMSLVYQGKESMARECDVVRPGQSRYTMVTFTRHFNIPIKNIDITAAKDETTKAVIIGDGYWSKCWKKKAATTKSECYGKAKEENTYGFAWSEEKHICLVYTGITDPANIQLNRYTSESRRSLLNPCQDQKHVKWFPDKEEV